jgi:hypothetical protein
MTRDPIEITDPHGGVLGYAAPEPSGETMAQREEVCAAWHALPDELRKDQRLTRLYHALGGPRMDDPAEVDTSGVNAVAAPLVDWPAIHRGFASAAPAVEAAARRINEAAEALMANHFGGLGLRGPNVNDPPTYPRPPAPPRPPGVKGPDHG